jgi:hypothetical protein
MYATESCRVHVAWSLPAANGVKKRRVRLLPAGLAGGQFSWLSVRPIGDFARQLFLFPKFSASTS